MHTVGIFNSLHMLLWLWKRGKENFWRKRRKREKKKKGGPCKGVNGYVSIFLCLVGFGVFAYKVLCIVESSGTKILFHFGFVKRKEGGKQIEAGRGWYLCIRRNQ